jgi:hypothetical protein
MLAFIGPTLPQSYHFLDEDIIDVHFMYEKKSS